MPNWWIRDNEEALERAASDTLNSFPSVEIADARIDAVLAFDRTEQLGEDSYADACCYARATTFSHRPTTRRSWHV